MKGKYRKYGRMGMGICALLMKAADGGITVKLGMGILNGGKRSVREVIRMAYFNVCPRCHATLDPGEKCDCEEEERQREEFFMRNIKEVPGTGQLSLRLEREGAGYAEKTVG